MAARLHLAVLREGAEHHRLSAGCAHGCLLVLPWTFNHTCLRTHARMHTCVQAQSFTPNVHAAWWTSSAWSQGPCCQERRSFWGRHPQRWALLVVLTGCWWRPRATFFSIFLTLQRPSVGSHHFPIVRYSRPEAAPGLLLATSHTTSARQEVATSAHGVMPPTSE